MFKTKRRITLLAVDFVLLVALIFFSVSIIPVFKEERSYSSVFTWITSAAIFLSFTVIMHNLHSFLEEYLLHGSLYSGETLFLTDFINRLRYCYSYEEFYRIIQEHLEKKADCSIMFVDRAKNYVLYNSPNRLTCDKEVMDTLNMNFPESWKEGIHYIGDTFGIVSDVKKSRGFFLVYNKMHFYVFCRYTRLFDDSVYSNLYEEFSRFCNRTKTISNLSEIASLSQEWQQLADTQRSFLPQQMPKIDHLEIAAYFRPLVNVSGDYYTVLPITKSKTLLMLGDVSGKGLAAALVMGLVMNTVKSMERQDDLPSMIHAVDKAIKGMKLQDKYTVLFLGIVDTNTMTISYVNASMSDPLIITRSPDGYRIKPLTSNCSLVGIIDIPEVEVTTQRLFRGDVILMASDGVSEVMDENGVELGTTKLYQNTICTSAEKSPKDFIDDVVNLVHTYNGGRKLRDDLTMMVAKVVN